MTRGTRQLAIAIPLAIVYLLMLVGWVGVPLVQESTASAILPVVSCTAGDWPGGMVSG